jgi:hypothetical protein
MMKKGFTDPTLWDEGKKEKRRSSDYTTEHHLILKYAYTVEAR